MAPPDEIKPPDLSLVPVATAFGVLLKEVAAWLLAVFVQLPRYLLFAGRRRAPQLKRVESAAEIELELPEYREPEDSPKGWVERNPGLHGFALEVQLAKGGPFEPVRCNSPKPLPVKNEFFDGEMLFMLATEPADPGPRGAHLDLHAPRRFEMQIRGKCLVEPTGGLLLMGAELQSKPRLSFVTTTLVKGVMSFVQRRTSGLEWSMGGKDQAAYCCFPLVTGVDYLTQTPAGEAPPELGGTLPEEQADRDARRAHKNIDDMPKLRADGTTYAIAFYSGFIDFANWRVAGMPVGSPSLDSMMGDQPIDVVVYDQDPADPAKKRYWMRYRCRWDPALAEFAVDACKRKAQREQVLALRATASADDAGGPASCPSGQAVACSAALAGEAGNESIAESRGYAVLREQAAAPALRLVGADAERGAALGDGHLVRVQLCASRLWLTHARGGWVAWRRRSDPRAPRAKASEVFLLREASGSRAGLRLRLGDAFELRSPRQPDLAVAAVDGAPSARYGGRLLRLRRDPGPRTVRLNPLALAPVQHESDDEENDGDFEEYGGLPEEKDGWTVGKVRCAGFVELVDRQRMRARRAYVLVATLERPGAAEEPEGVRYCARLRTAEDLAGVLKTDAAPLQAGPGGRADAPALRRARRDVDRDRRAAERARARAAAIARAGRDATFKAGEATGSMVKAGAAKVVEARPLKRLVEAFKTRTADREEGVVEFEVRSTSDDASPREEVLEALGTFDDEGLTPSDESEPSDTDADAPDLVEEPEEPPDSEEDDEPREPPPPRPVNAASPWLRPLAGARPPHHRSAADCAAFGLQGRLDAWVAGAAASPELRREVWAFAGAPNALDGGFLRGGAAAVGVGVGEGEGFLRRHKNSKLRGDDGVAVVARALGEGHWAEQLAVAREGRLDVLEALASSTATPALSVPLHEVLDVRALRGAAADDDVADERSAKDGAPLPDSQDRGFSVLAATAVRPPFPTLVVETVGLCHYLGFATAAKRDAFARALAVARSCASGLGSDAPEPSADARDPRDAFVLKPRAYRGPRLVLNARRLALDVDSTDVFSRKPWEVARDLLRRVFQASPDADAKSMARLFDEAAALKRLPLSALADEPPAAVLAFFLNAHHALLQHAWLVLGAPQRPQDLAGFHPAVSYDVLGDVFSLSELRDCVVRGRLHAALAQAREPRRGRRAASPEKEPEQPQGRLAAAGERARRASRALADRGARVKDAIRDRVRHHSPPPGISTAKSPSPSPDKAREPLSPREPRRRAGTTRWGWPHAPPPPPDDPHWDLALAAADCRAALAAHPGTTDFPAEVLEYTPDGLARQLNDAVSRVLELPGAVHVDDRRRVVTLPAACELLRSDLVDDYAPGRPPAPGDRDADVVRTVLRFVGKRTWRRLSALLLPDGPAVTVRFRPPAAKCHEALRLVKASALSHAPSLNADPTFAEGDEESEGEDA